MSENSLISMPDPVRRFDKAGAFLYNSGMGNQESTGWLDDRHGVTD